MSNEFHGNPESGIDQFLNQSAQIEAAQVDPYVAELRNKLEGGERVIARQAERIELLEKAYELLKQSIDAAEQAFKELLEGDVDAAQTAAEFSEIAELLDWELTREVKVTVISKWYGTIELPYGVELEDVEGGFSAGAPEHDGYPVDFDWGDSEFDVRPRH